MMIRPGAIGDTLLTLPLIAALPQHFENPDCTLVGKAPVLPLARASGLVHQTFDYEERIWSELFSLKGITSPILKRRLESIDLVVAWLRDEESLVANNLSRLVPRAIVVPGRPPAMSRQHILAYLASTLDLSPPNRKQFQLRLLDLPLTNLELLSPETIAIHPGSGGAVKCWPITHFADLITSLQSRYPVLLLAGPADVERFHTLVQFLAVRGVLSLDEIVQIRHGLQRMPQSFVFSKYGIKIVVNAELMYIARCIQSCQCFVGNDAGITHLAALLGCSTLALFGPSDPAVWHPVGRAVRVLWKQDLSLVSISTVEHAIRDLSGYNHV